MNSNLSHSLCIANENILIIENSIINALKTRLSFTLLIKSQCI